MSRITSIAPAVLTLAGLALAVLGRTAAADHLLISAGVGESGDGAALIGDLAVRLGGATATARIDHGTALLIGYDLVVARRPVLARWDDRCLAALRAESATARCWDAAVQGATQGPTQGVTQGVTPGVAQGVIDRALVGALGVRRDAGRIDALAAVQIHPTADLLGDVIELAATVPVAGRDEMYVHHARFAPGWYARAAWRFAVVRVGGEAGMTGLATRSADGTTHAEVYAIATLALAVEL